MDKFKYTVNMVVEVEAFDESDAWAALQDILAVGPMESDLTVLECEYHAVESD